MINKDQLKELIDSTLKEYMLYSKEASELVYGTIIQESKRGTYIKQVSNNFDPDKHALGIAQIEKKTFNWLKNIFISRFPKILWIEFEDLEYDLKASIIFCRLRYLVDSQPIPKDLEGQAEYWKRIYNSYKGKGTPEQYINNYIKYS